MVFLLTHNSMTMAKRRPQLKGRGAQINPSNPYSPYITDSDPTHALEPDDRSIATQYIEVYPKTILNKVTSPDIPMEYSLNPYQGCEHGCVYCYARNTHPYWGYSAGVEFEQKILYKKNAAKLLAQKLRHPNWKAAMVMLSGNTDCYQPVEKKLEITRQILETFWRFRHPVGIITKNSLVLRDLDILKQLNQHKLVRVAISLTTLQEELRQFLEPRTTTIKNRLKAIQTLSELGIPVTAMLSPIIPGLNEHEILPMAKAVAEAGALSIGYTMVRLNGDVGPIFEDWLQRSYPDRAEKVLNKIRSCHGGQLKDSRFGKRMSGEGQIAAIINKQFKLAKRQYFQESKTPPINLELYEQVKKPQMKLF